MAVNQNSYHEQMQAQMTICLDKMRAQVAAQMIDIHDEMHKRPRVKGSENLPSISDDKRLNRNEDSMAVAGMTMGVPGLSGTMETIADVGMELYGSRKATYQRPQDDGPLSFREIRAIQELNNRDMHAFGELGRELDRIDIYLASGYKHAAMHQGSLQPVEDTSPAFKYKPEAADENFANLNYAPRPEQKPRWAR